MHAFLQDSLDLEQASVQARRLLYPQYSPSFPSSRNTMTHSSRLRQPLLSRLRWNVFGPLADIQILDTNDPTFSPFLSHALASQSVAHSPLTTLHIFISVCETRFDNTEGDPPFDPPAPLTINASTQPYITLLDFVLQTHAWLNAHRADIMAAEDELYYNPESESDGNAASGNIPEDARFWFDGVEGYEGGDAGEGGGG